MPPLTGFGVTEPRSFGYIFVLMGENIKFMSTLSARQPLRIGRFVLDRSIFHSEHGNSSNNSLMNEGKHYKK